jgi:WD40 repeat protein/nucleoside phosphorylase
MPQHEPLPHVDVLVLAAVQDELDAVRSLADGWQESRDNEGYRLYTREFQTDRGHRLTLATAWIGEMGKQSAAIRGKQLLDELHPSCLAMCGVCAGYREEVALGDIIVADQIWAAGEGKHVVDAPNSEVFYPALRTFDLKSTWKMDAAFLAREFDVQTLQAKRPPPRENQLRWILHALYRHETENAPAPMVHPERAKMCPAWTDLCRLAQTRELVVRKGTALVLTDKGRDAVEADFVDYPDGLPAEPNMRVHVGAIATVQAVEKDAKIFDRLRLQVRNTIGLEMEGSAIGDLALRFDKRAILVKAVQDYADTSKDDAFRAFACEAAARFLLTFLQKHWDPERILPMRDRRPDRREFDREREDPYLVRIEQIAALHHPSATLTRRPAETPFSGLIEIDVDHGGFYETHLVAALDKSVSPELIGHFISRLERPFRDRHPFLRSTIVHQGESASKELREETYRRHNVKLTTFREYQGLFDLTHYLQWQTARLEASRVYPPNIYVDPPATYEVSGSLERHRVENALRFLWDLLASPDQRRFALVLGEFGAGKTFLLRELCRRMVVDKHPVWPVLVEMDKLEKRHDLPTLLAAHFAQADVSGFNFKAFQYLLDEGRIALLFDGFDELADRVTYDSVNAHFDTVLSAARGGQAKVVLSSRRQHFLSEAQVKLDLARRAELVQGFHMVLLLRFEELQIRQYLQNVLGNEDAARERYALIDDIKDLLGLSHNPRMLGFIVGIPEASLREAKRQQGTITAAGLYDLLVTQWLDGEYERERRRSTLTGISRRALGQGMTALASSMWKTRVQTVEVKDIREVLGDVMRQLGEPALDPEIVTHLFASGSLLVRDADSRFSFVHRSVMEWLVAREAARELVEDADPIALDVDEMSPLMADFFTSMASPARAVAWARGKLFGAEKGIAAKNATLVLQRLGESFEHVNFAGQDLRGKDFSGADWRGADLRGTNLEGATLVFTNLSGANLEGARLVRANLTDANLEGALIGQADFRYARLLRANFTKCSGWETTQLFRTNLAGATIPAAWNTAAVDPFGAPATNLRVEPAHAIVEAACASIAFDPTGSLLAAGYADATLRIFDAVSGEVLRVCSGHSQTIHSVAFSPNGRMLASSSDDYTVRLWDVATGREKHCLEGHAGFVWSVAWSPNGAILASGSSDRTILLWNLPEGEVLTVLAGHQHAVTSVAWSPDGRYLVSASADKTLRLWDVAKRLCVRIIEGHNNAVLAVTFAPDGLTMATGSSDKTIRLWDVASGKELRELNGHWQGVYALAFAPDGQTLASGDSAQTIRIWNIATGRPRLSISSQGPHVRKLAYSPDGRTIAAAASGANIQLWDAATGQAQGILEGKTHSVFHVAWSANGQSISYAAQGNLFRSWNVRLGRLQHALNDERLYVMGAAFDARAMDVVYGTVNNTLECLDLPTGRVIWTSLPHTDAVGSIAMSLDGKFVASASTDQVVRIWDAGWGQRICTMPEHGDMIACLAFMPDSRTILAGCHRGTLRAWDVESGRILARQSVGHANQVTAIAPSPLGKLVASASNDGMIRISNLISGKISHTLEGHTGTVWGIAYRSDGRMLASGSADKTIRLWDMASGQEVRCLQGHVNSVWSVAFSPDGRLLASGSVDNTVRIWDVDSGRCLLILLATPEGWASFTPEGRYKFGGNLGGAFWHVAGLCRFEAGEIDAFLPQLRVADNAEMI